MASTLSSHRVRQIRRHVLSLIIAAFTVAAWYPRVAAQDPPVLGRALTLREAVMEATELIDDFLDSGAAPGIAVSIGYRDKIVWHDGFGYADLEQRVPIWPQLTLFRVGSLAKPMTALAVAQLYEKRLLDLDVPIQKYVPTFPEKRWPITTRQLGGHLAGIRHYLGDEFYSNRRYASVLDGLEIFSGDTLLFEPGTRYFYTTYGWNLISAVVEGASGTTFLDYMNVNVFGPLDMTSTTADHVEPVILHRSRYYEPDSLLRFVNSPAVDNSHKWAGGGFLSTADDLIRFGFEHLNPETVSRETVTLLWTSQETVDGARTNYGIGWGSGVDELGRRWVGHTGGSVGGSTFFRIYPESGLVIALIANASSVNYRDLPRQLADLFMDVGD